MDLDRQRSLLDRVMAHRTAGDGTDLAPEMYRNPIETYVDPDRYAVEIERLYLGSPVLACLSCDVASGGDYVTLTIADVPILVARGDDGRVRGFRNVCRHRGACVVTERGNAPRAFACQYHGWTYRHDGQLVRPTHREGFAGLERGEHGLAEFACDESAGLVFVQLDAPPGSLDAGEWLAGAETELAPFDLASYSFVESRSSVRDMNWKLMYDTYCEPYHIRHLHHATIDPYIYSDFAVNDSFGPHGRIVAARRTIDRLDAVPRSEWQLLPYATINYFIVPNTVLIYQQDHVQLFQFFPEDVGRTRSVTTLYAQKPVTTDEERRRWKKSLDIVVDVIDREDYVMCEQIQRSFRSGAQKEIVFGRNEPSLIHFHEAIESLLWR
ncbi:MAG: Rieske 2Fe-2S domain-containing protein [Acidimicrobiia bacterium]|nr:Rieske 2Fe-2S domain-containing protein [Acidimicrobiia bacterium]